MTLIGQFNNPVTRLNLLKKKPLFLSLNHRPAPNWYNRTRPLAAGAPFPGLTPGDIASMVVANAAAAPNNAVIAQNNITIHLDISEAKPVGYGGASVYELHAYQANPGGAIGCQYLSWEDSCIVSMDLSNVGPPLFMSGPFNGCHFYATRDTVTNQIRVHHANANMVGLAGAPNHGRPDLAEQYLDALMQAARGPNENIIHQMRKGQYLAKIWNVGANAKIESAVALAYRNRKEGQNRSNVVLHETMCLVFGVRTAPNTWDFFFNVAGVVDYKRPGLLPNRNGYLKAVIPWQQI